MVEEVTYADFTNFRYAEKKEWRNILYSNDGRVFIWRQPETFMELTEELSNGGIQFQRRGK